MVSSTINSFSENKLRVALPTNKSFTEFEPTQIHLAYEYMFLENIYSSLVEVNPKDGMIQSGVASEFDWIGDDLHLKIRKGLKTRSGHEISSDDVIFSLKRLLVLSGNTHGNFKDLVCPGIDLKSVDQICSGIRKDSDDVILTAGKKKSFLLPMLAAADFSIIPRHAVDAETLKIKDYSETSGVYSVTGLDSKGHIELEVNKSHFHYSKDIAQKVSFVLIESKESGAALAAFKNNLVDHLMTSSGSQVEDLLRFAGENSNVQAHPTQKIRTTVLVFTPRGEHELSQNQRRYIAIKIKSAFSHIYSNSPGFESATEYFPALGAGGLSKLQQHELEETWKNILDTKIPKFKLAIVRSGNTDQWALPVKNEFPQVEIQTGRLAPSFMKYQNPDDEPHAYIVATDTGFFEDIGLISYSLSSGLLGLTLQERQEWLADYMSIDDRKIRIDKLQKLHFHALMKPVTVPLVVSPFVALTNKYWKMELSDLFANNQLWLIKHQ